jgi:hypothetical protein
MLRSTAARRILYPLVSSPAVRFLGKFTTMSISFLWSRSHLRHYDQPARSRLQRRHLRKQPSPRGLLYSVPTHHVLACSNDTDTRTHGLITLSVELYEHPQCNLTQSTIINI